MIFFVGLVPDLDSKSWLGISTWGNRLAALEPNPSAKNPAMDNGESPSGMNIHFSGTFNPESSSYSGRQRILDSDENTARRLSGNFLNGDEKAAR